MLEVHHSTCQQPHNKVLMTKYTIYSSLFAATHVVVQYCDKQLHQ